MKIEAGEILNLVNLAPNATCDLIASVVNETDDAKQLMRSAGFGVTGQGILETTKLVLAALPENISNRERK